MRLSLLLVGLVGAVLAQEPEFPLTVDSKVQEGVAKGTMVKGGYVAGEESVFPGTQREYQLYLPAGFDKTKPAAFMVFQDGVIYQAPVVFDNLIAKGDIPPLVGVFIKPGVVPAANENALPRFNRSFEYDSVTPTYSRFLIGEFLPAVEREHGITFSTNPNEAAIAGNSSGGICAFMVAWHRPDRFRRVFTGVGTYVGIHGADQLPVWVRKFEPKPIRVFLQSGTGDNNLYCGDWWMANQMMERSLTWAGYEVKHAWGDGGHNQKHASQVFPEAMRWLWREWKTEIEVKANVKGESKWKGYEVVGAGEWEVAAELGKVLTTSTVGRDIAEAPLWHWSNLASDVEGEVIIAEKALGIVVRLKSSGQVISVDPKLGGLAALAVGQNGDWFAVQKGMSCGETDPVRWVRVAKDGILRSEMVGVPGESNCVRTDGLAYVATGRVVVGDFRPGFELLPHDARIILIGDGGEMHPAVTDDKNGPIFEPNRILLSPDQTWLYASSDSETEVMSWRVQPDGTLTQGQRFVVLDVDPGQRCEAKGMCVDQDGRLYVATALGVQVCDQAGRVNFIIPTPKSASDVCFGGKDLGEFFIACGDTVYKRVTKAKGVVSGQMAPIKPPAPKL